MLEQVLLEGRLLLDECLDVDGPLGLALGGDDPSLKGSYLRPDAVKSRSS